MSLGLREERRRRRRHFHGRIVRWLLALALIAAAGAYAYQTGTRLAEIDVARLEERVAALTARTEELEAQIQTQNVEIIAQRAAAEQWHQRYEREVPGGEAKKLFDLLQAKLLRGVTFDRLRTVVEQTENRRDCDQKPQARRVPVLTAPARQAKAAASIAGTPLSLTLTGVAARNGNGKPEAWFDPAQPVTVRMALSGGRTAEQQGQLPLHPSIIEGDREYRVSVAAGARGFAQVTIERCRFP